MFTRERKLELLAGIVWDYDTDPESVLAVLEGRQEKAEAITMLTTENIVRS